MTTTPSFRSVTLKRSFDDLTNRERWRCATRLSWASMDVMAMKSQSPAWRRKLSQIGNMERYIAGDRELWLRDRTRD